MRSCGAEGPRLRHYGKQFLHGFYESGVPRRAYVLSLMWGTLLGCVREGSFFET